LKFICATLVIAALLDGSVHCNSQSFLNLNFNAANIPNGTAAGSMIPITDAIPDWTAELGGSPIASVLYDDLSTGLAAIAIIDTNGPAPFLIPGNNYTVVLQSGAGTSENLPASIAQTALIPSTAKSIVFEASVPYAAGWQVTVAGQNIPVTEISAINSGYGVFAGNIAAYAGQTDQLEFTALAGSGPTVNLYLDEISFSTSPVPEPTALALTVLGGLSLIWRWRRKSST
jgi:hypothetical protein